MKILVPLDGSSFSESILERVRDLAAPLQAEVELMIVERPGNAGGTPASQAVSEMIPAGTPTGTRLSLPLPSEVVPQAAESREQAVERVDAEGNDYLRACARRLDGIATTPHVVMSEHPAEAIIDLARSEQVDLIAMATHGRSGLSHLIAGSVTERVLRSGVAPVLVLRPSA